APPAESTAGGGPAGRWSSRKVWVPNAFPDAVAYRSAYANAMQQEEMQLILDEAAATPYAKAEAKLVSNDPQRTGPRIDRRDPLWRQKHFRAEGVHYYASVSLFRAGDGGKGGGGGGGWFPDGLKKKRQRGWGDGGGDDDDEENEKDSKRGSCGDKKGKLYLKILGFAQSKEAASAYGKGDVWALSETGRFADVGDAVFCRREPIWSGVSSQGMISVEPLGDETEAFRLEGLAGRGGGRGGGGSARSVHAIRCFNAQV
ncbi:unnamed protein product, partial [Sphacelaria rigidula]